MHVQWLTKTVKKINLVNCEPWSAAKLQVSCKHEKFDVSDESNLLKLKDINTGFASSSTLKELKRKDLITNGQIAYFFSDVMLFICSTAQKLLEKSPIFYNIVCNSLVFDPQILVNENIEEM